LTQSAQQTFESEKNFIHAFKKAIATVATVGGATVATVGTAALDSGISR
jgi:hypothetical protein